MHNSVNGEALSAALHAQASGRQSGPPDARGPSVTKPRLPAWAVLVLAIWLGAMAGGLAGVVSTW